MRRKGYAKRVMFVENGMGYGGAVICMRHLVRNLDRARFEPVVVTGRGGYPYSEIAAEATWHHIPDRHLDVVGVRARLASARWPDRFPGLRILLNQFLARLDDLVNFLPFFVRLVMIILRDRPALIHANNEPLCNRAAILAGALLRIPVICHVRGDQQGSRMMRSLFRFPDHFISVSRWISDSIGRLGVRTERQTVVYDGVNFGDLNPDADGSAFREAHGIPRDAFAVGMVGLLIPWKGQRLFLDAGRVLVRNIPSLSLVIVGGTPEDCQTFERDLRREAAHAELAGKVVFTGHVADMRAAYKALDVVVSASTSPEPLGVVVMESMALGRPLVAPDHGGAVEIVEHGRTGLLFRHGDAADLAREINRLYTEPGLRGALSAAGRSKALEAFSIEEHAKRVQDVYERVLAQKGSLRAAEVARPPMQKGRP